MKSSSCHVEIELANTDTETSNTEVPEAQHPGPVSDDHCVHLVALPVVDHARHLPAVFPTEVHSSRPSGGSGGVFEI